MKSKLTNWPKPAQISVNRSTYYNYFDPNILVVEFCKYWEFSSLLRIEKTIFRENRIGKRQGVY